ncbi:MAG: GGDEF domain-containing protein [Lachnospiraceae bacterium]|nr:GGDEF domain-containing protein [Lachnospiraceae bacterium]
MEAKNKKKRIGFVVGNYHSDHSRRLVKNYYKLAEKHDFNAHFFLGTESSSFLTEFSMEAKRYDYQYASLYSIGQYDDLDALIVSIGTSFSIYQSSISNERLIASLPDIPMVLTETKKILKKGTYLIIDNYGAIHQIIEHLVKVHKLTKIAFLGGPAKENVDAAERFTAYMDAMEEYGLPHGESLIRYGDFSEHVDPLVEELLDLNPGLEAIVSANDEMAISAYRVCKKRGLLVGHDIAITGFDDMELACFMSPPLTTARQDYEDMSRIAVDKALALLDGKDAPPEEVPCAFIRRSSCCCPITDPKTLDALFRFKERGSLIQNVWKMHDHARHSWVGALITRELLMENTTRKQFFERLGNCFHMVNTKSSIVSLFEEPRIVKAGEIPVLPDYMLLYLRQKGDQWEAFTEIEAIKVPLKKLRPADAEIFSDGIYMIFLLFYENIQYGIMGVEISPEEIEFYYTLSLEIGSALRYLNLSLAHQRYQDELQSVARHDNLTGLFNRLGFFNAASDFTYLHRSQTLVAMMADLDHLKQINDTFGHVEGDFAIKKCAQILSQAIGQIGILGRTGGDEFMGMFAIDHQEDMQNIQTTIKDLCQTFNDTEEKPYYIELSLGCITFTYSEYESYNELIRQADLVLYEAKKKRRASVLK